MHVSDESMFLSQRTSPGFTLLEILIALSIVATVFTTLFAVFDRVTDVADAVDRQTNLSQEARLVVLQIQKDLNAVVLPDQERHKKTKSSSIVPVSGQSPDMESIAKEKHVLTLTTWASLDLNIPFPGQQMNVVRYSLTPVNGTDHLYSLYRLERPALPRVSDQGPPLFQKTLLSSHISSLQIGFFDPEKETLDSSWEPKETRGQNISLKSPSWISLKLDFSSAPGQTRRFEIMSVLPMEREGTEKK
mgnify:FL=1